MDSLDRAEATLAVVTEVEAAFAIDLASVRENVTVGEAGKNVGSVVETVCKALRNEARNFSKEEVLEVVTALVSKHFELPRQTVSSVTPLL